MNLHDTITISHSSTLNMKSYTHTLQTSNMCFCHRQGHTHFQVTPSIHISWVTHLQIQGYFRRQPFLEHFKTYTILYIQGYSMVISRTPSLCKTIHITSLSNVGYAFAFIGILIYSNLILQASLPWQGATFSTQLTTLSTSSPGLHK